MNGIIDISLVRLAAGYVFVLVVLAIAARWRIGRTRVTIIATARMTVQLVAVGFLLEVVFERPSPWVTVAILLAMTGFASWNVFSRVRLPTPSQLRGVIVGALSFGTVVVIFYFVLVIVAVDPWYAPQYFIPIAGMLIGNSMTGITLGYERLVTGIRENAERIEAALMLGAEPAQAAQHHARHAFATAILPTINSMMGMGIVFLPGMMTGQILSGTSPVVAIRYQIAIMLGIMGAVTITVALFTSIGYRTFFTPDVRLVPEAADRS